MHHRTNRRLWPVMALAILCPASGAAQDLSVADIVERSAQAMGGSGRLEALRTIRFEILPPGQDFPTLWEIVRPNLVRKELKEEFILIFDGHRAGFLEGPRQENGTLAGPHLIPDEDWHHFEMDIALYVPAFLEYPSEYEGRSTLGERPVHILRVTLPLGGVAVYAIDAESFLPVGVDLPDWGLRRRLGNYRDVGGVMLPHRFWNASDPSQATELRRLAVNVELDPERFAFPSDVHR